MAAGMKSRRVKRVAEQIRQELGRILLAAVSDPRIGFVTVTRVDISADLRSARVYVSLLGSPGEQRSTLRGLNSAQKRIRGELGQSLDLRCVPGISFHEDGGVKQSIKMSSLLSSLARERAEADPGPLAENAEENGLQGTADNHVRCQ